MIREIMPSRSRAPLGLLVLVIAMLTLVAAGASGVSAKDKKKKSKKEEAYALLVGSVFDGNGLRMRGVAVRIREKEGKRKWDIQTDGQGEFAVHLPPGPAVYLIETAAPGYGEEKKEVSFAGDERQDISLRLWRSGS